VVSVTSKIIADNLNGVIEREFSAVELYNTTLIIHPVACINTDRYRSI